MMPRYDTPVIVVAAMLLAAAAPVRAQITLTADDVIREYQEATQWTEFEATAITGADAVFAATGTDATYDFTTMTFAEGDALATVNFTMPADVPGASNEALSQATHVQRIFEDAEDIGVGEGEISAYNFVQITEDGVRWIGQANVFDVDEDGVEDTTLFVYDSPIRQIALPLTYPDTWEGEGTYTATVSGFTLQQRRTVVGEVEGWGTLITPAGTAPALRVRETITIETIGVPLPPVVSTEINFITREGFVAYLALNEEGAAVEWAGYTVFENTSASAIERLEDEMPARFRLEPNYPNPFNPQTTIHYSLTEAGAVELRVFDTLGREVATLVDAVQAPGRYRLTFEAADLPSGVYLYRLAAGTHAETRSMLLIE